MSTIILPTIRRPTANLYRHVAGGVVTSLTNTFGVGNGAWFGLAGGLDTLNAEIVRLPLWRLGLSVGDLISARAQVAFSGAASTVFLAIDYFDSSGTQLSTTSSSAVATPSGFVERVINGATIPANTVYIGTSVRTGGGTGTAQIRNVMLNRGATAAAFETPKRGASAALAQAAFGMQTLQSALRTAAGVTQITSFPSRLWALRFSTIPFAVTSDEVREWELALNQLSDLANVFLFVPPDYRGPSTGYAGGNPLVNGGSQLGTSLVCDGVDNSTAILKAGDYASVEVTSPLGSGNVQLFKCAADATSNGSGAVTLTLTKPIRQAPADNAVVQIFSPTAQFILGQAQHETDSDSDDFAQFPVDAIEQIYP